MLVPVTDITLPKAYGPFTSPSQCPRQFLCCSKNGIYRNPFKLLACCQKEVYDRRLQQCENGTRLVSTNGDISNMVPPSRFTSRECGGAYYIVSPVLQCCDGTFYDIGKGGCPSQQQLQQVHSTEAPPLNEVGSLYLLNLDDYIDDDSSEEETEPKENELEARPLLQMLKVKEPVQQRTGPNHLYLVDDLQAREMEDVLEIVCESRRFTLSIEQLKKWGCCGTTMFKIGVETCYNGNIFPQRTNFDDVPQGELLL